MIARRPHLREGASRQRGAIAILAMMFLVIFGSLAAAMAIVAQGNLATADSHMKINRAAAAAETGMRYFIYRLEQVTPNVKTTAGIIDSSNAAAMWAQLRAELLTAFSAEFHNIAEPYEVGEGLHIGPIAVAPGEPQFSVEVTPHPIASEDYDSAYYQRPPYNAMAPAVSNASPLGPTWIRVKVTASDGPSINKITRSIKVDFQLGKKIRYAVLSKSRVMIGRNVLIDGDVGSRFLEVNLLNGHPVQMVSDFRGMSAALDGDLDALVGTLMTNDANGDNRINIHSATETAGITDPASYDTNGDGFIDDYDFFLARFDANADGRVSALELDASTNINNAQLLELIDTAWSPSRPGYNDGFIDGKDRYAKVSGSILISADLASWQAGAANGAYQDYFAGPIRPKGSDPALKFQADNDTFNFGPKDFDVATFKAMATGDLASQATAQAAMHDPMDPSSPKPLGSTVFEQVPFGAAHPYDYYDRPVYENMTFTNVKIPKGTNALFKNCKFVGVTFVESTVANADPLYAYAGIQESDGTQKYPDKIASVNGSDVSDTKTLSNNIRFEGCTFEGSVVTDAPDEFTQTRNKLAFTGKTKFVIDDSTVLTDSEKVLFKRSTILAPHYSVELGTFVNPYDSNEVVNLTGTIVAGLIDMRGQVKVTGTIITTFEPKADTGPVLGETSPQFNTTLGYFPSSAGDLESELPANGIGVIHIKYDPTIPLPDGILGPISLEPMMSTWFEGGAD
jgi:hypothetical protein